MTSQPTAPGLPLDIAVLGAGSMGEALAAGVLAHGAEPEHVRATVHRGAHAQKLAQSLGIEVRATDVDPRANAELAGGADVVVVALKPALVVGLLDEISDGVRPGTVVVSVAAGVTTALMERHLPDGVAAVRAMPNTPALVGAGAIAVSPGRSCGPDQLARAISVLSGAGLVLEVPEDQQDAVTAISGTGPAYFFYLAEALVESGLALGMDYDTAKALVTQTAAGAGLLLNAEGTDPATLRRKVTSPGGTTAAAIARFDAAGLRATITAACEAAKVRSRSMAGEREAGE